jgi:hypothetical protein
MLSAIRRGDTTDNLLRTLLTSAEASEVFNSIPVGPGPRHTRKIIEIARTLIDGLLAKRDSNSRNTQYRIDRLISPPFAHKNIGILAIRIILPEVHA